MSRTEPSWYLTSIEVLCLVLGCMAMSLLFGLAEFPTVISAATGAMWGFLVSRAGRRLRAAVAARRPEDEVEALLADVYQEDR